MKFYLNKGNVKKIIIAILIVMSFNIISPTVSNADADFGGVLFEPISSLIRAIADKIIEWLQDYFMGTAYIRSEGPPGVGHPKYYIKYSPGIIFSGNVAGLKTNFIDASTTDYEQISYNYYDYGDSLGEYENIEDIPEFNPDTAKMYILVKPRSFGADMFVFVKWTSDSGEDYCAISKAENIAQDIINNSSIIKLVAKLEVEAMKGILNIFGNEELSEMINMYVYGLEYELDEMDWTEETSDYLKSDEFKELFNKFNYYLVTETTYYGSVRHSSAYMLQKTVSTWYVTLRGIALVGLLSVLIYIGIRILISSTAQEKAKYRKMILDWITAICILFILQYIMVFICEITEKINSVLNASIIGERGEDVLMSDIRSNIGDSTEFQYMFVDLLLYVVLVIYTVIFTIQYLKRLVYLAFFTLISPLVALTYPLDKIKDGQSQAFSMWLREYIFNSLMQPMHLLLYYIFVSSARDLVDTNPLYAIVAIAFLQPAEKFFRKMFGFEKASSTNPINAAAGGAMIYSGMQRLANLGKGGGSKGGAGGPTPTTSFFPTPAEGYNKTTFGYNSTSGNGFSKIANPANPKVRYGPGRAFRGATSLAGRFTAKGGQMLKKGAIGAVGAAALGTVGLAAGISTGDASKVFQYGLGGAGIGYMGANALADKGVALAKEGRDVFEESALGTDEHNTRNSIRELTKDNGFNKVCKHLGVKDREALIRQFYSNGITNSNDIKKAMNAGARINNKDTNQIIAAAKIRQQATRDGMKRPDIENMLKNQHHLSDTEVKKAMDLIDML